MTDSDVTHVTRNVREIPEELKLAIDLLACAAMMYYVTHPDCLDNFGETARRYWRKVVHRVSIWSATQDIRSLPETEAD